jgi:hypothetical protein
MYAIPTGLKSNLGNGVYAKTPWLNRRPRRPLYCNNAEDIDARVQREGVNGLMCGEFSYVSQI